MEFAKSELNIIEEAIQEAARNDIPAQRPPAGPRRRNRRRDLSLILP